MAIITQQFDSLDKVPEFLRPHVVEEEGAFKVEIEPVKDVIALKNAEKNAKKERDTAKAELNGIKSKLGERSLDEILAAIEEQEKIKSDAAAKAGDHQAVIAQQKTQFEKETTKLTTQINERDATIQRLNGEIESMLVNAALMEAIAKQDGIPEVLVPILKMDGRVKVIDEDGQRVVRIIKDEVVAVGDSKGNPMTVEQFIETEFKSKPAYGGAFRSGGAGGSGAPSNQRRTPPRADISKLSPQERLKVAYRTGNSR